MPIDRSLAPVGVPWFRTTAFRRIAAGCLLALACIQGVFAVAFRHGDFDWHFVDGGRFLAGEPLTLHYFLGRTMLNAAVAACPYYVARGGCYLLALAALVFVFRRWNRIAAERQPLKTDFFPAAAITVAILLSYILRDLDDAGLQIFLLFFLTAAAWAMWQGRSTLAGFWLALSATYKCTPLLFLPFLLWKRQWRAAAWMGLFFVALNCAPALFLGWEKTVAGHQSWWKTMAQISRESKSAYPDLSLLEPPRTENLSLQAAIARYLETFPPGHALHVDHPLFLQFGSLDTRNAKIGLNLVILALGGVLAWSFRKPWGTGPNQSFMAAEWAVACLFCALMSPITWKQHFVLAIPCIFLLVGNRMCVADVSKRRIAALWLVAAVVNLSRKSVIGWETSQLLLAYKFDTFVLLLAVGLVLTMPDARNAERGTGSAEPESRGSAQQSPAQAA